VPLLWLLFASAIGGYILVWDQLAQYIAIVTTEWIGWLPMLSDQLARNFLAQQTLSDRLFSLLVFLHIAIPLFLLVGMLIHIKRIKLARSMPPRNFTLWTLSVMVLVSLLYPAVSMPSADMSITPREVRIDWIYMNVYPLLDRYGPGVVWALLVGLTAGLIALPKLSPLRTGEEQAAVVDPANCNGCTWCFQDCPFEAVTILPHDYKPGLRQAHVNPDFCTGCGICVGACPSATPFRRVEELVSGIEVPNHPLESMRQAARDALARLPEGRGTVVFGCDCAAPVDALERDDVAAISLPCIAMLPPSFVDFMARQPQVSAVIVSGCHPEACAQRLGSRWVEERMTGARDPHLRTSAGQAKVALCWAGPFELQRVSQQLAEMQVNQSDVAPQPAASGARHS
jgi:ferredoxin/coenzyme F420-reducing hydrogenase delta subunit